MDSSMDISMDSAGLEAKIVSVGEVTSMDDAELAQFHGLPNSYGDFPVYGWDELSKDEPIHLTERLEAEQRSRAQTPKPCSSPLDLTALDARLHQVSLNTNFTLRSESQTIHHLWPPTPPFDPTRREIDAYHDLVNAGGRPAYPIGLIQEVYRDPKDYAEILRPWQEYAPLVSRLRVFQVQLQRWQDFRKWQNDNRDRDDDDGGFLAFVEREKHAIERDDLPRTCRKRLAEIEADPSCLQSRWDQRQYIRQMQRRVYREHGCRGFREYIEAVKRRLARYGFTQPFELDEDPKKQGKLTTWIEYLNYEYWWLDKYASENERLEAEHDKLLQELVEKNLLNPHETKDTVYAANRHLEQERNLSHLVTQFVVATLAYNDEKRNIDRHRIVVQWVLDQLPLIESEVNLSNSNNC